MKRKEEIRQASIDHTISTRPMAIGGDAFADMVEDMNVNPAFIAGAEWADKTMIEKACKWLEENADKYVYREYDEWDDQYYAKYNKDKMIKEFRKLMED